MPRATAKSPPKAVVVARESDRLTAFLRLRQSIDAAVSSGRVVRTKIAEAWVYHPSTVEPAELIDAASAEVSMLLGERFVVPLSIMAGMASASMKPPTSKAAARALLHHLVAGGALGRFGLLTTRDDPHLAVYRPADSDEIHRQFHHISAVLAQTGSVGQEELLEPAQPRHGRAWAATLLEHGEFAGWGRLAAGRLHAWPRP